MKIKVALLFLLILILGIAHYSFWEGKTKPEKSLLSVISQCQKLGEFKFYECFRKKTEMLLLKTDVNRLINSLSMVFEGDELKYREFSCHDLSHIIGQTAVKNGGDLGSVLVSCTTACEYGCAHGALTGGVSKKPELLKNINTICSTFSNSHPTLQALDSCEHGLGHAVSEFTGMDLFKSLEFCGNIETQKGRNKCTEGVFMQITDYLEVPYFKIEGQITSFCNSLDSKFVGVCLETASLHEWGRSKDISKASMACDLVPIQYRSGCIINLVNLLHSEYDGSGEKILNFCSQYKASDYNSCILGAIQPDVLKDRKARLSLYLCNSSSEEYRDKCLDNLKERYEYVYGNKNIENAF